MLSLSPGGALLLACEGGQLRLVTLGAAPSSVALPVVPAQLRRALAFDDQVWTVEERDGGLSLSRFAADGQPLAPPVPLPAWSRPWLRRCPGAATAALAGGGAGEATVELQAEAGELQLRPIAPAGEWVFPRSAYSSLMVRDQALWLLERGTSERLMALPEARHVLGGGTIYDGKLLVLWLPEMLLLVDPRQRSRQQRIRVDGATRLWLAPAAGQALLLQGDRRLALIELRLGKLVWSRAEEHAVVDLAVDERAGTLALQLREAGGELRTRLAAITDWAGEATAAAPELPVAAPRPVVAPRPLPAPVESTAVAASERPGAARLRQPIFPRCDTAAAAPELARAELRRQLEWVASCCKRAVARGWDTGRIAFAGESALPFERELAALLDGASGRAAAPLAQACAELAAHEARLQAAAVAATPLDQLAEEHGLSPRARRLLMLVAAPALRGELARAYALVANNPARPVCDELLLAQLLEADLDERVALARELDPETPLVRAGLVAVGAGARPFAALTAPQAVIRRLTGDGDGGQLAGVERLAGARRLAELSLPRRLLLELAAAPAPAGRARLVVRGRPGTGRKALVAALAAESGRDLGLIAALPLGHDGAAAERLESLLREVQLRGWVPCLVGLEYMAADDPVARERVRALLRAHAGPLALVVQAGMAPPLDGDYQLLELVTPDEEERAEAWQRALGRHELPAALAAPLAMKYRVGPGAIERTVAAVARQAPLAPPAALPALFDAQLLQQRESRLGAVATRVQRLASWSNVVLPPDVADSIRELISRVRHRRIVFGEWGFDGLLTSARGLTALFSGGPGTGKSMVAGIIARELGYELYRVDLSRVLSKWVGDTEKNLGAVFDAAEEGEAVLLFDEADSLFAKRTPDVKSSNDRYANLEVNYLLERLDAFEGIAILTTNSLSAIDPAFKRRLSLRLNFPFPDEGMRERLWQAHLPSQLPTAGEFDFATLARKYQLSGGYIRNATVRAAFLAAAEAVPVSQAHLERAVSLEYREVGKLLDSGVLE